MHLQTPSPKTYKDDSDYAPVVQQIIQENLALLKRLTAAEERIQLLEAAVYKLQDNSSIASAQKISTPPTPPIAKSPFINPKQHTSKKTIYISL